MKTVYAAVTGRRSCQKCQGAGSVEPSSRAVCGPPEMPAMFACLCPGRGVLQQVHCEFNCAACTLSKRVHRKCGNTAGLPIPVQGGGGGRDSGGRASGSAAAPAPALAGAARVCLRPCLSAHRSPACQAAGAHPCRVTAALCRGSLQPSVQTVRYLGRPWLWIVCWRPRSDASTCARGYYCGALCREQNCGALAEPCPGCCHVRWPTESCGGFAF